MNVLPSSKKNDVLSMMARILSEKREEILQANQKDLALFQGGDRAMYDRLVVNDAKINQMIKAINDVKDQNDPVGKTISEVELENGLKVINKTDPFGTILIIYESRPDVTIEAASIAFKANNKILLKGGKEAIHSNRVLTACWHEALEENGLGHEWIQLLELDRKGTQQFLKQPTVKVDLIVPRGGERLIEFVKQYAQCAVLVSGRGNNFLYIHQDADWNKTLDVILNAKTHKISACNALDKILIDAQLPNLEEKTKQLLEILSAKKVETIVDKAISEFIPDASIADHDNIWYEEFLAMKVLIGIATNVEDAVKKINLFSGGHSNTIMTENEEMAQRFMEQVDSAVVYHNASTRFTDGGQMGAGAELAISTDKLHHRGPLGLVQLVTNKYYVFGNGQIRS